jgi:hypothetical protein
VSALSPKVGRQRIMCRDLHKPMRHISRFRLLMGRGVNNFASADF